MKILSNIPNTSGTSDYPNGKINDDTGAGDGTPVNEAVYGDIVQFFQKLVIDASITENDLPDNVTNGYQLITALIAKINEIIPAASTAATGFDYIGNANLPIGTFYSVGAPNQAMINAERNELVIVSAKVTYTGAGFSVIGGPLPTTSTAADAVICTINSADLQLKYPSGLAQKYFLVKNFTTGANITVCINTANELFVAEGSIATGDVLNLQFVYN